MPPGFIEPKIAGNQAPLWKIWANPILRRYCRSRLRPHGLGVSLLITLILAGFLFFMFRSYSIHRADMDVMDAERTPLISLLVLQGVILFLLGTGQAAGGMTTEEDEGVIDYQRLAPMSPMAKVIGYLFGLPVREYVALFATLPFSVWALWRGGVPPAVAAQLYGVLLSSAILYHLTGLVAGTVVKNRRWAFLISMGAVFMLYTVAPQMARFGLVYFKYFTLWPVFDEFFPYLIPRDAGAMVKVGQSFMPNVRFFRLNLPESVFTVLSQSILALTAISMLWRRWRRTESHLLGKLPATGLFLSIQIFLLGNALPLIEPGLIFPSKNVGRFIQNQSLRGSDWKPESSEALAMTGFFGLVSLIILWALTLLITPGAEGQLRGWRRARKLNRSSIAIGSDPATAFWWVALMAAAGAGGWFIFTKSVIESSWFPGQALPVSALGAFTLVFFTGGLGFHAMLESRGGRSVFLAAILGGVLPILVGVIVAAIDNRFAAAATWLIGMSPGSASVYASATVLPVSDLPRDLARAMPRAFWFWQGVAALATLWLIARLIRSRKAIAAQAAASGEPLAG